MADDAKVRTRSTQRQNPVIVAVGASAGGITALQALFGALPDDTGASYVVIVHLDPEHRSELAAVLAAHTAMRVVQVVDGERLEPNSVYVIPPDRQIQLVDHEISVKEFEEPRGRRTPINLFFRSLADHLGDGIALILSGAGSDGALGVKAVKEAGGVILVQDPAEAEYSSMPRSAIGTGVADFVLPMDEMVPQLVEFIHIKQSAIVAEAPKIDEEMLLRVLAHLRVRTGHDFSKYKRSTVLRRIARRMQVTRQDDLPGYYEVLRDNQDEAHALLADLLISVTTFFRDASAFDFLTSAVLPQLFAKAEPTTPIRVWVPGCATGEEAYSIAILFLEEAAHHDIRPPIQIFASDLDARALAIGREGRYPEAISADVNEERLRRFFTHEGDQYRVRQEVRDTVLFAIHDVLKDPPFSRVDLISCRNVLIYLDRELQEQVLTTFHYGLNPGGFLMLGSSESADNPAGLFHTVDRNARVYQSTARSGDRPRLLPRLLGPIRARDHAAPLVRAISPSAALNEATLHRRALEQLAPPSIIVDEHHRVLHLSESAGRFIMPSGGPLTGDIGDLVRPELRFELRSALNRAFEHGESTLSLPIPVRFNGHPNRVHILVRPYQPWQKDEPRSAVAIFIEGEALDPPVDPGDSQAADDKVRRLSQELELTQDRLRTTREESDAANEELRAANEELQSINEEYRSTAEELETSKEELQSINEELQTVNSELKLKLETISRAHSDLQNLMAATDFGTLFLDTQLRIKRFTDRVTELFSITPSDEGRPITDFAHRLDYGDLVSDARHLLSELSPIRREVQSRAGRWYDMRMRPYRTVDNKIDGVVITFVDITDRRQVEEALRRSELSLQRQKRLVDLSRDPIFIWDFDGGVVDWNRGSEELYGFSREEALGKDKARLLDTFVPGSSFAEVKQRLLQDGSWSGELHPRTKDGRRLIVEAGLQLETFDRQRLVLESGRDVTERKALEERQRLLLSELTHRVKNTLTVVQAIAHQTLRSTDSPDDFVDRFDGRLAALATAHGLLVASDWRGADLATLARQQLEPYAADNPNRIRVEGAPVALSPDLATPFGLVLHELATNAAKYGALSTPGGSVEVSWTLARKESRRWLTLIWRERGGPPVSEPSNPGFGTTLIEQGIPEARVTRTLDAGGLVCRIEVALPEGDRHGVPDQT